MDLQQSLRQCAAQLHRAKTLAAEYEHASRAGWRTVTEYEGELKRLRQANLDCVEHFNAIKAERDELLAEVESLKRWQETVRNYSVVVSQRDNLLAAAKELQESAAYWSEYDVPLGIVDRLNAAIANAEA